MKTYQEIIKKNYWFADRVGETNNGKRFKDLKEFYEKGDYELVLSTIKKLFEEILGDKLVERGFFTGNKMDFQEMISISRENGILSSNLSNKLHKIRMWRNKEEHFSKRKTHLTEQICNTRMEKSLETFVLFMDEVFNLLPEHSILYFPNPKIE